MKFTLFCLGFLAVALASSSRNWETQPFRGPERAFRAGQHYTFHYDGQVSAGIPLPSSQFAMTRIQAVVSVAFENDRVALLKIQKTRVGNTNSEVSEPRNMQPFGLFKQNPLTEDQNEQLMLPMRFRYEKGMISELEFEERDQPWSANIKRAIVNMLQVNLQKKARTDQAEISRLLRDNEPSTPKNDFFTTQELLLDGDCETAYTVVEQKADNKEDEVLRVSKSVNYDKCTKRVDIRYNYRFGEECESCEKKFYGEEQNTQTSTVLNYKISGNQDEFLIREVDLRSQYLFSPLNQEQQLMATYVTGKLQLVQVDSDVQNVPEPKNTQPKQSLVYSTEWEEKTEKFRMTGDESLIKNSPFLWMQNKSEVTRQVLKQLAQEIREDERSEGYQLEQNHQFARLVEVLRVSTKDEVKKISNEVDSLEEKEKLRQLFIDALAVAGTKNTIEYLSEMIVEREISQMHAARLIKSLASIRNPSEQIVEQLLTLSKEDAVARSPILKQSVLLTTGAVLNGLCGEQRDRLAREVSFERKHNMCPRQTKEKYSKILEELFERASNRYEKVLVLKTMANAGYDMLVFPLEKIIKDQREEPTIRVEAIEALRQLPMPRKIQSILMPIYKNKQIQPEIRVSAFNQIMKTLPERSIIDQVAQQLEWEPSRQMAAFVYSALQGYAKSDIPCERTMAQDIEQSLRLARVPSRNMYDSLSAHPTLYSSKYYTGASINWAALFTNNSMLPSELSASLDTVLAGQWNKYLAQIGMSQKNIDQVLYQLIDRLDESESWDEVVVRGKRSASMRPAEVLRQLMQKMGIRQRRSEQKKAHAMVYIRIQNLDYALLPIDEQSFAAIARHITKDGVINLSEIEKFLSRGLRFNTDGATFLQEKSRTIPTSLGLPVEISSKTPTVASIQGELKIEFEPKNSKKIEGLRIRLATQPKLATSHVVQMEVRSPVSSSGVKMQHSLQVNVPVDVSIDVNWANKNLDIKSTIKSPEMNRRVVLLYSRPSTYTRQENSEQKMFSSSEKTVFIPEQPRQPIKKSYGEELFGVRINVNGNIHRHLLRGELEPSHITPILLSENHLEVVLETSPDMPREYAIHMNVELWNQENRMESPEFEGFFEKDEQDKVFKVEDSDSSSEDEQERRSSFSRYSKSYKTEQSGYKSRVQLKAETVGSPVERKAELELRSKCDEALTYCKWSLDASRTPVGSERREWQLRTSGQVLYPEPVQSLKQMREQKHREVQSTLEAEWGAEEKSSISMKVQAEQSKEQKKLQKVIEEKHKGPNSNLEQWEQLARAARLNQVKIIADYQLSPSALVESAWARDLLVASQPWSSEVEILSPEPHKKQGRLIAKIAVEPENWRYANISVMTPSQRVTLRNVYLPIRPTYWSIEKSQPISHFSQLRRQLSSENSCEVSSSRVSTFDDVIYRAPITTCYSVLAKDCSSEQPKFAVLMKKVQKSEEENKLKIITKDETIEIEYKNEELTAKVNGKAMEEKNYKKHGLRLSGEDVIVFENEDIVVRFDGYKAKIELGMEYKNQQCGICGHFDGETKGEFRMPDNEDTDDMELFHRSFLSKDEECEVDEETLSNKKNYKILEESYERESSSEEEEYGMSYRKQKQQQRKQLNYLRDSEQDTVEPEEKTQVIEYSHRVCFSKQSVPVCPQNTHDSEDTKQMKVKFACVPRSNPEARRLLRDSRKEVLSLQDFPESFVESFSVPVSCVVY